MQSDRSKARQGHSFPLEIVLDPYTQILNIKTFDWSFLEDFCSSILTLWHLTG